MKRAGLLWALPLVLVIGTAARANDAVPTPTPLETAAVAPATQPAAADAVSLELNDLKGDALAHALGQALGTAVRIDGIMLRGVTLQLDGVSRAEAMAQVATAVKGTWRRTFVWATGEATPEAAAPKTKQTLSVHLKKAPCSTAATIVAAAVGATTEGQAQLPGRVTIEGREIALVQALDTIAKEARASWRDLLVLRLPTAAGRPRTAPKYSAQPAHGSAAGRTISHRQRRTRETVLAKYGAVAPPAVEVDPEIEEARASLGTFAGIFALEDRQERVLKARKLRAAMETQNRRLDNYRPENRRLAYTFELRQLRGIMGDYEKLTEDQKKEVKPFVDYVRKRLATVEAAVATKPAKTGAATPESPKPGTEGQRADAGK